MIENVLYWIAMGIPWVLAAIFAFIGYKSGRAYFFVGKSRLYSAILAIFQGGLVLLGFHLIEVMTWIRSLR